MLMRLLSRNISFKKKDIIIGKRRMSALLADSPRKMAVGLMFRKSMKQNECMLFVFPEEGDHPIWMRNMKFPIDIIWYNNDGKVVDFVESAKPSSGFDFSSYRSKEDSKYVLEAKAGFVKKNNIKRNNVAKFRLT